MGSCIKPNNLFGSNKFIKFDNFGNMLQIEGSNTLNKMVLNDLRFPYEQSLRGRINLNPGQVNYPFNFLGLGDNATFVAIRAFYDEGSRIEADNFVQYYYVDCPQCVHTFGQMMLLTGNSENRIPQLYFNNPNPEYPVSLDVMVAVIDDQFSFFQDNPDAGQSGSITFTNLRCDDIITYEAGETIAILNPVGTEIAYINIDDINSIEREGRIIIIDDASMSQIFLQFIDEYHAIQAFSILNWVLENPNGVIQDDLDPRKDNAAPVITFTNNVFLVSAPSPSPSPAVLLTSLDGDNFLANPLSISANNNSISKQFLLNYLVTSVLDNRDGSITLSDDNLIITDSAGNLYSYIMCEGDYIIKFNLDDLAENNISEDLNITLEVTP